MYKSMYIYKFIAMCMCLFSGMIINDPLKTPIHRPWDFARITIPQFESRMVAHHLSLVENRGDSSPDAVAKRPGVVGAGFWYHRCVGAAFHFTGVEWGITWELRNVAMGSDIDGYRIFPPGTSTVAIENDNSL